MAIIKCGECFRNISNAKSSGSRVTSEGFKFREKFLLCKCGNVMIGKYSFLDNLVSIRPTPKDDSESTLEMMEEAERLFREVDCDRGQLEKKLTCEVEKVEKVEDDEVEDIENCCEVEKDTDNPFEDCEVDDVERENIEVEEEDTRKCFDCESRSSYIKRIAELEAMMGKGVCKECNETYSNINLSRRLKEIEEIEEIEERLSNPNKNDKFVDSTVFMRGLKRLIMMLGEEE